jgi:hypothetical protein
VKCRHIVVCMCIGVLTVGFGGAEAGSSSVTEKEKAAAVKQRDAERDRRVQAKPVSKDVTVRRFVPTRKEAESEKKNGVDKGKHMTASAKGRPPTGETARKQYGLEKTPKYVETVRIPKGAAVKSSKVIGGAPGRGEKVASKTLPVERIDPVRKSVGQQEGSGRAR